MPDIRRVVVIFTGVAGSPWYATHFLRADTGSAASGVTAVGAFWESIDNHISNLISYSTQPEVATLDENTGETLAIDLTTPVTSVGEGSATILPPVLQGLITWDTGVFRNGRRVRGRTFVPGLTINAVSSPGVLTTSVRTAIDSAAETLVTAAGPCVWHRPTSAGGDGVATIANGATVDDTFAYLSTRRD
jgi:hypothetical protein